MTDPIKLTGFQSAAFNAISDLDEAHAVLLPTEWPASQADVLSALITLAGLPRGTATNTASSELWKLAPAGTATASASMQVTVAMPATPVKDSNEAMYGKWADHRQQRDSRYAHLMQGNVNAKSFSYLGDTLYFMFSDLAAIIATTEAVADAVARGELDIENDEYRQALRSWRRAREKQLTMDLDDDERAKNWTGIGTLLTPAFRTMLGNLATIFEARMDIAAFDDHAIRQATGGETSVSRLSKTIMAAAQFISDNIKKLRDVMDSQSDLMAEIDKALEFLRNEELQTLCGVKNWTEATADAGISKVLAHFGNTSGAPAIQLGFDWREFFFRLGDVLAEPDGVIDAQDLFYIAEPASAIQSDASFVEFGMPATEEEAPSGRPFQREPVGLAADRQSTGFTKKWQVWFLKAHVDFGFSFSQSSQ